MSFWDKLFGLDRPAKPADPTTELLLTAHGNEELAAVEALLRSAEIPYRLCERGAGSVMRIVYGYNMYGTDVYIRPEDVETANALLEPIDAASEASLEDETADTPEQPEESEQ